ncbi:LuxR C-terminal-related transcriptional regulator [Kitasatospora sp. MY 5-36]|uniref:LuxR C-terminal-related transcriptional regulator n=1 Tax=Kitasatospora sp. MY 5-36 TaxID=1678027 RepID=UPI000AA56B96|nr:LuxR C-terminal-related transcriptional regulator [Kitasatospora sp. MY 5-36]
MRTEVVSTAPAAQFVAVLDRVGLGMTNAAIGTAMDLSVDTVKYHLRQAYDRLGTANRVQAFAWAWQSGLLTRSAPTGAPPALTDEQTLILRIWAAGGNRLDVARALEVRERAAELYEDAVLDVFGTRKRVVAVRRALEHQLIAPAGDTLAGLTTPTAADSGQGRARHHRTKGAAGASGPVATTPAELCHRSDPVERAVAMLRSTRGLVVHLGALAALPEVPSLAEVLAGAAPRGAAPTVVRLVHQALALGLPCALVLPSVAVDPDRAVEVVGLRAAWSCAVRQGAYDGTAAYVAAAHRLGAPADDLLLACTADQVPVAGEAGFRRVLATTSFVPRMEPRRAPVPELNGLERRIAELAAEGLTIAEIGGRVHTGEYLVRHSLADLRRRTSAVDDAHLAVRLITTELIGTERLRAGLPARVPELDQAGRAVLTLICTGTMSEAGANAAGLSLREARTVEARVVRALSWRGSRTHAAAVALVTGLVALPPTPLWVG